MNNGASFAPTSLQTYSREKYFKSPVKNKTRLAGRVWYTLHILRWFSPTITHLLAEAPPLLVGHLHPFVLPGHDFFTPSTPETPVESLPFVVMPVVTWPPAEASEQYFAQDKQPYRLPVGNGVKVGGSGQNGVPEPLYNSAETEGCDQDKNR
ncbi:hypothetical protein SAMN04487996_108103 [Dyadobacter soli]|uniref:Uncharacterized protein n=1 Tax=Dyadobacter soli TaxID=659014 RepID=A0A1G7HBE1_9BACT|nr:hypothetical protein SAMN04487996_108103 [Dyadobacter soli]